MTNLSKAVLSGLTLTDQRRCRELEEIAQVLSRYNYDLGLQPRRLISPELLGPVMARWALNVARRGFGYFLVYSHFDSELGVLMADLSDSYRVQYIPVFIRYWQAAFGQLVAANQPHQPWQSLEQARAQESRLYETLDVPPIPEPPQAFIEAMSRCFRIEPMRDGPAT